MTGNLLFCSVVLFSAIGSVQCLGYVETNFKEFVNFEGKRFDGRCCDKPGFWSWGALKDKCTDECDHKFVICMGNGTQSSSMSACEFGQQELDHVGGNKISFNNHVGTANNPVKFQFGTWPGVVKLKIDVHDEDGDSEFDFVDHYEYQHNTRDLRREIDAPLETLVLTGTRTRFNMELKVYCDIHYYGQNCDIYCTETDDDTGHYRCDPVTGDKVCKLGWTGNECLTNIDDCVGNRCSYGSTCIDGLNFYSCRCPPGRTGFTCELEVNECASLPCQNGGRCLDASNSFICQCTPGFAGPLCEVEIDECRSGPCLNGGACVDRKAEFMCVCQAGFTGDRCEIDTDECTSNPCIRAEQCVDLPGDYKCDCFPGFTGKNCDYNVNECISSPCKNGGWCIDEVSTFRCICQLGFTGSLCEGRVNYCEPNYCQNGATCSSLDTTFECHCTQQYTGKNCEIDVNECEADTQLCGDNGICVNSVGSYSCKCNEGFEGNFCEVETDECLTTEVACLNDGICIDLINDYRCNCNGSGFFGRRCEEEINECESSPCENNGFCIDRLNGFVCNCSSGFSGERCEINTVTSTTSTTSTTFPTSTEAMRTESETTVTLLEETSTSSNDTIATLSVTQLTLTSTSSATTSPEASSESETSVETVAYTYPSPLVSFSIENETDIQSITTMASTQNTEVTNKTLTSRQTYIDHAVINDTTDIADLQISYVTMPETEISRDVENTTTEDTVISTSGLKVAWSTHSLKSNVSTTHFMHDEDHTTESPFSPVDHVTSSSILDQSSKSQDSMAYSVDTFANKTTGDVLTVGYTTSSAVTEEISSGETTNVAEYFSSKDPTSYLSTSEVNETEELISSGEASEYLSSGEIIETDEYLSSGESLEYVLSREGNKTQEYKSSGETVEHELSIESIGTTNYISSGSTVEYASSGEVTDTNKHFSSGETSKYVSSGEIVETEEHVSSGETVEYASSGEVIETDKYFSSGETSEYVSSGEVIETEEYVSSGETIEYVSSDRVINKTDFLSYGETSEYVSSGESINTEEYISSGETTVYASSGEVPETHKYFSSGETSEYVSSGESIDTEEYISSGETTEYASSGEVTETHKYYSSGETSEYVSSGEVIETEEYVSSGETVKYVSSDRVINKEDFLSSGETSEYVSSGESIDTEEYISSGETTVYAYSGEVTKTDKYFSSGETSEYVSSGEIIHTKEYVSSGDTVAYASSGEVTSADIFSSSGETSEYASSGEIIELVSSGRVIETEEYLSSGETSEFVSSGENTKEYVSPGDTVAYGSSGEVTVTDTFLSSGETSEYESSEGFIETKEYVSSGETVEYVSSGEVIEKDTNLSSDAFVSSREVTEIEEFISVAEASEDASSEEIFETGEYISFSEAIEIASSGEVTVTDTNLSSRETTAIVSSGDTIETEVYESSGDVVSSGDVTETEDRTSAAEASEDVSSGEIFETEEYTSSGSTIDYELPPVVTETIQYLPSREASEYVSSREIIETKEYISSGESSEYVSSGDFMTTKEFSSPGETVEYVPPVETSDTDNYLSSGDTNEYVSSGEIIDTEEYVSSGEKDEYLSSGAEPEKADYSSVSKVLSGELTQIEEYTSPGATTTNQYLYSGEDSGYVSSGETIKTVEFPTSSETTEYMSSGEVTDADDISEEYLSSGDTVLSENTIKTEEYVSSTKLTSSIESVSADKYSSSGEMSETSSSGEFPKTKKYKSSAEDSENPPVTWISEKEEYLSSGETGENLLSINIDDIEKDTSPTETFDDIKPQDKRTSPNGVASSDSVFASDNLSTVTTALYAKQIDNNDVYDGSGEYGSGYSVLLPESLDYSAPDKTETEQSSIRQGGIEDATVERIDRFMISTTESPVTTEQSIIWTSSEGQVAGDSDSKLIDYTEYNIVSSGDGQFIEYKPEKDVEVKPNFMTDLQTQTAEDVTMEAIKYTQTDFSEASDINDVYSGSGDAEYNLNDSAKVSERGQDVLPLSTRTMKIISTDEQNTVRPTSLSEIESSVERSTNKMLEEVEKDESSIRFAITSPFITIPHTATETETITEALSDTLKQSTKRVKKPKQFNETSQRSELFEITTYPQSSIQDKDGSTVYAATSSFQTIKPSERTEKIISPHDITKLTSVSDKMTIDTTTSTVIHVSTNRPGKPIRPWLVARKHLHAPSTTTSRTTKTIKGQPINPWLAARRYIGRHRPKPRRKVTKVSASQETTKLDILKIVTSTVAKTTTHSTNFNKDTVVQLLTKDYDTSTPRTMVIDKATETSITSDKLQTPVITSENDNINATVAYSKLSNVSQMTEFPIKYSTYNKEDNKTNLTKQTYPEESVSQLHESSSMYPTSTVIRENVSAPEVISGGTSLGITKEYTGYTSTLQSPVIAPDIAAEDHTTQKMTIKLSANASLSDMLYTTNASLSDMLYTKKHGISTMEEHILAKNTTLPSTSVASREHTLVDFKDMDASTSEFPFKTILNDSSSQPSSGFDYTTTETILISTDVSSSPPYYTKHSSTSLASKVKDQVFEDIDIYTTDKISVKAAETSPNLILTADNFTITSIATKSFDPHDFANKTGHVTPSIFDRYVSENETKVYQTLTDFDSSTAAISLSNYTTETTKPTTTSFDEVYNHTDGLVKQHTSIDQTNDTEKYEKAEPQTYTTMIKIETVKTLPTFIPCIIKEKCGPMPVIPMLPDSLKTTVSSIRPTVELTTKCESGYCKTETTFQPSPTISSDRTYFTKPATSPSVSPLQSVKTTKVDPSSKDFKMITYKSEVSYTSLDIAVTETSVKTKTISQEQPAFRAEIDTTVPDTTVDVRTTPTEAVSSPGDISEVVRQTTPNKDTSATADISEDARQTTSIEAMSSLGDTSVFVVETTSTETVSSSGDVSVDVRQTTSKETLPSTRDIFVDVRQTLPTESVSSPRDISVAVRQTTSTENVSTSVDTYVDVGHTPSTENMSTSADTSVDVRQTPSTEAVSSPADTSVDVRQTQSTYSLSSPADTSIDVRQTTSIKTVSSPRDIYVDVGQTTSTQAVSSSGDKSRTKTVSASRDTVDERQTTSTEVVFSSSVLPLETKDFFSVTSFESTEIPFTKNLTTTVTRIENEVTDINELPTQGMGARLTIDGNNLSSATVPDVLSTKPVTVYEYSTDTKDTSTTVSATTNEPSTSVTSYRTSTDIDSTSSSPARHLTEKAVYIYTKEPIEETTSGNQTSSSPTPSSKVKLTDKPDDTVTQPFDTTISFKMINAAIERMIAYWKSLSRKSFPVSHLPSIKPITGVPVVKTDVTTERTINVETNNKTSGTPFLPQVLTTTTLQIPPSSQSKEKETKTDKHSIRYETTEASVSEGNKSTDRSIISNVIFTSTIHFENVTSMKEEIASTQPTFDTKIEVSNAIVVPSTIKTSPSVSASTVTEHSSGKKFPENGTSQFSPVAPFYATTQIVSSDDVDKKPGTVTLSSSTFTETSPGTVSDKDKTVDFHKESDTTTTSMKTDTDIPLIQTKEIATVDSDDLPSESSTKSRPLDGLTEFTKEDEYTYTKEPIEETTSGNQTSSSPTPSSKVKLTDKPDDTVTQPFDTTISSKMINAAIERMIAYWKSSSRKSFPVSHLPSIKPITGVPVVKTDVTTERTINVETNNKTSGTPLLPQVLTTTTLQIPPSSRRKEKETKTDKHSIRYETTEASVSEGNKSTDRSIISNVIFTSTIHFENVTSMKEEIASTQPTFDTEIEVSNAIVVPSTIKTSPSVSASTVTEHSSEKKFPENGTSQFSSVAPFYATTQIVSSDDVDKKPGTVTLSSSTFTETSPGTLSDKDKTVAFHKESDTTTTSMKTDSDIPLIQTKEIATVDSDDLPSESSTKSRPLDGLTEFTKEDEYTYTIEPIQELFDREDLTWWEEFPELFNEATTTIITNAFSDEKTSEKQISIKQTPETTQMKQTTETTTFEKTTKATTQFEQTTETTQMVQTTKTTPLEQTTETKSFKQTTEKTQMKQTTKNTPFEQTAETTPSKQTTETTQMEQTTNTTPFGQTTETTTSKQTTETTQKEQTTKTTPFEQTTETTQMEQQTTKRTPFEQTTELTPSKQTTETTQMEQTTKTTFEQTIETTPFKHTTETTQMEQTTETTPFEQTAEATPFKQTTETTHMEQTTDKTQLKMTTDTTRTEQPSPTEQTTETAQIKQTTETETSSDSMLISVQTNLQTDGPTTVMNEITESEKPYIRYATILTYVSKGDKRTENRRYQSNKTEITVASSVSPTTRQLSKIRYEADLTAKNTYPNPKKETFEYVRNTNITRGKAKLTFQKIKVTVIRGYEEGKRIVLQTYQKVKNIATKVVVTTYRNAREVLEQALDRVEALWQYCKTGIDHYIVKPLLNARVFVKSKFEQTYARLNEIFSRGKEILKMTKNNVREDLATYYDSLSEYYTGVYRQYSTEVRDIFESLKIPDT